MQRAIASRPFIVLHSAQLALTFSSCYAGEGQTRPFPLQTRATSGSTSMPQGILLFSMTGNRRGGGVDRRLAPRGGRRIDDAIRVVLFTAGWPGAGGPSTVFS